jgi:G3E family GTPase
VTGIAVEAMEATTIALQWDLANAVVVRHDIDARAAILRRTVSDVTGVLEQDVVDLEHLCVSCAIREDIVPTLERLADLGRWEAIIAHLPVAADARQICRMAAQDRRRLRRARVAAVVCAVDGIPVVDDLLGDALLRERGLQTAADDGRGVGEVFAGLIEYADLVAVVGAAGDAEVELLQALVRPGARVLANGTHADAMDLVAGPRAHAPAEAWVSEVRRDPLSAPEPLERVWQLDLMTDRPFHPDRLFADLERIGGGPRRSRGCFWLPTRPGAVCAWDGAGGQLSVGVIGRWDAAPPLTRIVVTGLDDGAADIAAAFRRCLLDDAELAARGRYWEVAEDGFEAWLGDIRRIA